jgi:hypothetical protein
VNNFGQTIRAGERGTLLFQSQDSTLTPAPPAAVSLAQSDAEAAGPSSEALLAKEEERGALPIENQNSKFKNGESEPIRT